MKHNTKWVPLTPTLKQHPHYASIHYFSRRFLIEPQLMHWLWSQGFNSEEKIEKLFFPTMLDFHDPFLLNDMKKAIVRIITAIQQQQNILIFGDYDADGITATSILFKGLKQFKSKVSYLLPLREEGYGITEQAIEEIAGQNVGLIITVDNGSSAHAAMKKAKKLGIDVIISDHHDILQGHPDCFAFLNPKREDNTYPFSDLCGAGVAFKIVHALYIAANRPWHPHAGEYIELATIGTIADLVPIKGENRNICHNGIKRMNGGPQQNIQKLLNALNIKYVSSSTIGFSIGPILNAVGRVHDPNLAVTLLTREETTVNDFKDLIKLNTKRKSMTLDQFAIAEKQISKNNLSNQPIIVVQGDYFKGITGIIASKISEKFKKPSIVISACGTASCRGVNGSDFSMINTLQRCSHLFKRYGGHKAAAGFTMAVGMMDDFMRDVQHAAKKEGEIIPKVHYLCPLPIPSVSHDMLCDIDSLEPFGMGFQRPTFHSGSVIPGNVTTFGKNQEHLNIHFGKKKIAAFSLGYYVNQLRKRNVSFLYTSQANNKNDFLLQDFKFDL